MEPRRNRCDVNDERRPNDDSGEPHASKGEAATGSGAPAEGQASQVAQEQGRVPVVGLGGSAGALEAFEAFFDAMPSDAGAAFVVIQHLSPEHESLLPAILAKHTSMRVMQAQDGQQVEPDCVYIIPPNHHLGIRDGKLFLAEPVQDHGARMSIDFFFRCLAEGHKERAICILLSGAGTDGTLGARAIRGGGGMVIAQDPTNAQFGDMPRGAITAGLADHVLTPRQMPQAVLQYLRHPYVKQQGLSQGLEAHGITGEVVEILAVLLAQTGCDFRCYKPMTLLRRIGRRMGMLHIAEVGQYLSLLRRDPGEVKLLLKDILINVTSFFRDPEAFEDLRSLAIAPLVRSKSDDEPFRVWIPACASGEEAYSIVMLLIEEVAKAGKNCPLQLFATDLDEDELETARAGYYPENIAADVGADRLAKFFVRREKGYQVKESLRAALTFAAQNVITDPPFSKMDLVSCRNLMIYLNTDAQGRLMALFNFALKPGGFLFLGRSETIAGLSDLFEPIGNRGKLCRRLTPARPPILDSPLLPGRRRSAPLPHVVGGPATSNFADVVRLEILKRYGATAVLVDRKGAVLQFHGQADRYVNLPARGPNFSLYELVSERVSTQLRLAMHKAIHEGKAIVLEGVPLAREEGAAFARIMVAPVTQRPQIEPMLVVFFEDASGPQAAGAEVLVPPENEAAVKRLEDELLATQHDLQATIQELQSSNEDLRAANEEVTSTNEELQSMNEELVSSTEELQSSNEELMAVVSQLQDKVDQLGQANEVVRRTEDRFRKLVESSPNALLLAAVDGTITLANRRAEIMFGYSRDELIGRPIETLLPQRFRKQHVSYRAGFVAQPKERPMGAGRDLLALRRDGTEFPVEIALTPLGDNTEGLVTMATVTDISERKRKESER